MNHAAVRAVRMQTINRQRANILFSTFLDEKTVLTPEQVSAKERIFEWDGVLRWKGSKPYAKARIGVSLQTLLSSLVPPHAATGSTSDIESRLTRLFHVFGHEQHILWYDACRQEAFIVLKMDATPMSSLKAWAQALLVAQRLHSDRRYATGARNDQVYEALETTLATLHKQWDQLVEQLIFAGWDVVDGVNLETVSGVRVRFT